MCPESATSHHLRHPNLDGPARSCGSLLLPPRFLVSVLHVRSHQASATHACCAGHPLSGGAHAGPPLSGSHSSLASSLRWAPHSPTVPAWPRPPCCAPPRCVPSAVSGPHSAQAVTADARQGSFHRSGRLLQLWGLESTIRGARGLLRSLLGLTTCLFPAALSGGLS